MGCLSQGMMKSKIALRNNLLTNMKLIRSNERKTSLNQLMTDSMLLINNCKYSRWVVDNVEFEKITSDTHLKKHLPIKYGLKCVLTKYKYPKMKKPKAKALGLVIFNNN